MIKLENKSDCCGCSSCAQRCPKQCITMREDEEGFHYPSVDKSTCIDCGLCEKVCPILNVDASTMPIQVLAAKNNDEEVRMHSSSGGVFHALASAMIHRGGVVFGAVFDETWEVVISYTDNLEGIKPMMGSKYVQARVGDAYQEAELFLKQGREVLFTGTPCQVAGLKHFLRNKKYDNLLAVDFICHGVPSPGVWRRYLIETFGDKSARRAAAGKNTVLSSSLNAVPAIAGIEFRDKTLHGWKKFSFVVREKSASKADQNSVLLSDIHHENPYMRGFLSDIYLRPSCYACRCKNGTSQSDLTIADFWGINQLMPDFDDDKGVGLVLINSQKGKQCFESLPMEVRLSSIETVTRFNHAYYRSAKPHPKRDQFYKAYSQGKSVTATVNHLLYIPLYRRILSFVKRVLLKIIR